MAKTKGSKSNTADDANEGPPKKRERKKTEWTQERANQQRGRRALEKEERGWGQPGPTNAQGTSLGSIDSVDPMLMLIHV